MRAYLQLLRNRPFALLWLGATISLFGDGLTWISLVWLTYELGGSTFDVGVLAACYTGPVLLGGLGAGVLLDRFDRPRLLVLDNAIRGLAVLSIPIAAWLGVLGQLQLDVVAIVYGLLYMVSLAGFPAILPDIVAEEDLSTANAMESVSFAIGGVVGPAAAGLLIGLIGAANNLALDALTYGAFVACLLAARFPRREGEPAMAEAGAATGAAFDPATAAAPAQVAGRGLRPAVDFVRRTPAILAITIMFMAFNVGEGMLTVLLPVFARDILEVDAAGYGLLVSAFTAGVLVGSVLVGAVRWPWSLGRSIAAAQLAAGLAVVGLAGQPAFGLAIAVLAIVGFLASPLTIWAQTIRMRLIPEALRGRVFSLLRTLMQSTPPVGGLVAGTLLAGGGFVPAIAVIAVVMGGPGAIGLIHRSLARASIEPRPAARADPVAATAASGAR